jgi:dienelactone hydrolase
MALDSRLPVDAAPASPLPLESMTPQQQKREDPDWVKMVAHAHIFYRVPGMENVAVRQNLAFKTTEDGELQFDLYSPVSADKPAAAVVLIHGGPVPSNLLTTPKDWGLFHSFGRLIGASGLAAVTFNHRFFGLDKILDAQADIRDLIAHVQSNAGTLGVDAGRLCLWFFSGGGVFLADFLRETPDNVQCVVAYYAVLHASVPQFSAAAQIAEKQGRIPPILIARAGLDTPALNEGTDYFVQQALKKNANIELLNHASGQHGFDGRDDNERTRDILKRTVEFIRSNL